MQTNKDDFKVSQLDWITRINLDDFISAFGVKNNPWAAWILRKILSRGARIFGKTVINFDQEVQEVGLTLASRQFMSTYVHGMEVTGMEYLPAAGPVLILSNHPGITDTLALFANLPRPDLRVVSLDRPFLRAMPETSRRLIFVPEINEGRLEVIRSVARHLRHGGAVLTFPAGEIEPDPALMPGAVDSLNNWAQSIALFVRMSPETQIIPVIVSGVYSPQALHHPLTRIRRRPKDRESLAAILQILAKILSPTLWPVTVHVDFGRPILAADLLKLVEPRLITQAVTSRVEEMLQSVQKLAVSKPQRQSQLTR